VIADTLELGQQCALTLRVAEKAFGLWKATLGAASARKVDLLRIPLIGLLRNVRITGGVAPRLHRGDINVLGGREHHGIFSNLVVVQCEILAAFQPRIQSKHRYGAMVSVLVDGPLGKNHIRAFRREHATESLVVFGIDDRAAVVLAGERGARLETFASLLGFGGADSGASSKARSTAIPLSTIEVEQHHLVSEFRVARNGSGAAAFRVARMTAGDHNLEGGRDGSRQERQGGDG
jgi:hypothetical protein